MKCWDLPALGVYRVALEPGPAHSEAAGDQDLCAQDMPHSLPLCSSPAFPSQLVLLALRSLLSSPPPVITGTAPAHPKLHPPLSETTLSISLFTAHLSLQNSLSVRAGPLSLSLTHRICPVAQKMLAIKCPTLISSVRK